jgi:TPP-dependent pyruvate/acetoin dehydrogenase alpha subunit
LDVYAYRLLECGQATLTDLQAVHSDVEAEVRAALERARAAPDAGLAELGLDEVYACG